ncbi:MAG: class I SAM-dependent methyltransferase [Candidatus Aenigmatarchaeota archaeon]
MFRKVNRFEIERFKKNTSTKDYMIRTQEWWNHFWANGNNNYGSPNQKLLQCAEEFIRDRKLSAVDIASGNGRYAIELAKMGYGVDAIEYADSGVERIRVAAGLANVNVNVLQGDFTELCLNQNYYDLVFCSGLLEEIGKKDHEKVILGFMNWTKPGGINLIKYCLEIRGRGQLVDEGFVKSFYDRAGWKILFFEEQDELHISKAVTLFTDGVDSEIRTGTVIAIKPEISSKYSR